MATNMQNIYTLACEKFKIDKFNDFQSKSMDNLLLKKDVFLSVRTGGGKSLVYQAYQYICQRRENEHCQVLIVTPLLSIMKEQCDFLNAIGFRATYIGRDQEEDTDIIAGIHDFVFTSPESLLGVSKWREMLLGNTRICLIVVDEAHTIIHWYGHIFVFFIL